MRARFASLPLGLLAAACGPQVHAPSLAPRAVEKQSVELPAPTSEVQTPLDPALAKKIAALVDTAEQGDRAFAVVRAQTARAVDAAKGAPQGSEAWTVAQQALSNLDIARGAVHDAAAEVDTLRQEPGASGTANRAAIDAAQQKIEALDQAQAAAVTALQGRLR